MNTLSHLLLVFLTLVGVTTGCIPDARELPSAPSVTALQTTAAPTHTRTFPNVDGSFGPAVLASCDEGYDLIFEFKGTVTIIETSDQAGNITRLQNVWNLTVVISNSVTGYTVSGPSYGPDRTTFNTDVHPDSFSTACCSISSCLTERSCSMSAPSNSSSTRAVESRWWPCTGPIRIMRGSRSARSSAGCCTTDFPSALPNDSPALTRDEGHIGSPHRIKARAVRAAPRRARAA